MRRLALAVAWLAAAPALAAGAPDARLKESVVKIMVGFRTPDYFQPWDMGYQKTAYGSGFIVDGHRIMTNAHVVANQTYIQVRKVGDTRKYTAHVEYVAHDCEIALLTVDDEAFFAGTRPVVFGGVPMQRDRVAAYGFPTGGDELSITEGIVSRIEVHGYSHSQRELLSIQIDAAINPGNSGGPVFKDGEVVGISFQTYTSAQSIGYLVPTPVIKRFYADIKDGRYDGYPELGLEWQKLENPAQRAYLHLAPAQGGVLVTEVYRGGSAWEAIKPGDVILAVAGKPVAQDGTVQFRGDERVWFSWALNDFQLRDRVPVDLWRDGSPKTVSVRLALTPYLVPRMQYDVRPTYFEFAGLVFMPLSFNFMAGWNWSDVDPDFRVLFADGVVTPERRQVVFINQVLPDDINIGYHDVTRAIVGRINGKAIADIGDVIAAFGQPVNGYHVIELATLEGEGMRLVLDAAKAAAANPGILRRYSVPFDRSEDLRQP